MNPTPLMLSLSKYHTEPVEGELPDFLKQGFPDIGLPPAKLPPAGMRFPELRPQREPCGHDRAASAEWAVREWARLVELGLIG